MKNSEKSMEKIVALCKGRGFIFARSEERRVGKEC